jgi:hypothetical protein
MDLRKPHFSTTPFSKALIRASCPNQQGLIPSDSFVKTEKLWQTCFCFSAKV